MGAVPKHKTSSYRKGKRRQAISITPQNHTTCPQCQSVKPSHLACPKCGYHHKTA